MIKRADGRWQQAVTTTDEYGRKKTKYFYGKTKADLARKLAEWNGQEAKPKSIKFKKLAEMYRADSEKRLSATTYKGYTTAYNRAVEHFGEMNIEDIRTRDVASYMFNFSAEHKGEKTNKTQLTVISRILQFGVQNSLIECNVAREIETEKGLKKSKRHMPTSAELAAIKAAPYSDMKLIAYLALYAGLRRGEMFALRWDHVDMDRRTIIVDKSMYWADTIGIKNTKTDAGERVIPIPERLYNILIETTRDRETVLPYMSQGTLYKRWNAWRREIGIETDIHSLRHGYATMLIEADIEPGDAKKLLGHAQISTTMDIYREIREARMERVSDRVRSIDIE